MYEEQIKKIDKSLDKIEDNMIEIAYSSWINGYRHALKNKPELTKEEFIEKYVEYI